MPGYQARRKVAGGVFKAFGAFFAEDWRENDILRGRLDAVERLISLVLNNNLITETDETEACLLRNDLSKVRSILTKELHETVLREKLLLDDSVKKGSVYTPHKDSSEENKFTETPLKANQ